jgi:LmbE family N-acetylglucosaminyl deacetylase
VVDVVRRLVVVAPHPDDEVLQAGGLMRWRQGRGGEIVIVAVTDGEASHARSTRTTPGELRSRRAAERDEALRRLGVRPAAVVRLGVPDQACRDHVDDLGVAISTVLRPADVVVTVSSADAHPDHVATATAARRAARGLIDTIFEAPTWALVHRVAPVPTHTLRLDDSAWAAKRHAIEAYRSQLEPLGPSPLDGPVVRPRELAAMLQPCEGFLAVST